MYELGRVFFPAANLSLRNPLTSSSVVGATSILSPATSRALRTKGSEFSSSDSESWEARDVEEADLPWTKIRKIYSRYEDFTTQK